MLKENAVVIDYHAGIATVKCRAQSACGQCAAKSACGSAALSELTGSATEHFFRIETITPLKPGQSVEIGLAERSLMLSTLLIYLLPLLTIVFSALCAESLFSHELYSAIFIFFCTALAFLAVRLYAKKLQKKSSYRPVLLRVL